MKIYYEIEKKAIFAPESYTLWPMDDPLARIVLYAPASQCFLLLLQNPGVVLSQKFLFAEVWEKNGLYVNANTLYQNIAVLRKTLKSIGIEEDVIKTVPRQGLKFGSSRFTGERCFYFQEEVVVIPVPVCHPLYHLDLIVHPLQDTGIKSVCRAGYYPTHISL